MSMGLPFSDADIQAFLGEMAPHHRLFVQALLRHIEQQDRRIADLEARLAKNSLNSSKPPSSDGYAKPKKFSSLQKRGDKLPGGQPGHPPHLLKQVEHPDHVIRHSLDACTDCGSSLTDVPPLEVGTRQVFDLPPRKVEVFEHQTEKKRCQHCGTMSWSAYPAGVERPVQYGPHLKALCVYLTQYQFLPYRRCAQFLSDVWGHGISEGALVDFTRECHRSLEDPERAIVDGLKRAAVLCVDETGMRCGKMLYWNHVCATEGLTHFILHPNRGEKAMRAQGILPFFKGVAVHDHWKPYYRFQGMDHALCNAHHLRELRHLHEEHGEKWADGMRRLLLSMRQAVEDAKAAGSPEVGTRRLKFFERRYGEILERGMGYHARRRREVEKNSVTPATRGRKKQLPGKNLLDRLNWHAHEALAFLYDFSIPFTNNQAERDIRMVKLKQKISGCFRSQAGGASFARIRSYLSTAKKQNQHLLNVLYSAFIGAPFMPHTA